MHTILWLVILVVFLMMEANTVALVSVWFAAGALAAMIAALLGAQFWVQLVVFLVVSGLLLACLRPITKKYFKPRIVKTNVDAIIGSQGYVTEAIDNLSAKGRVKLGAMEWSARSANNEIISQGTLVKVEKIEGVKVFVSPVTVTETI